MPVSTGPEPPVISSPDAAPPVAESGRPVSPPPGSGRAVAARWCAWFPLLIVLMTGAALRLHDLGEYWFHPDEGIHFDVAAQGGLMRFFGAMKAQAHPPLYYLALRAWSWISSDPGWLRLLSVLAGVLTLAMAYLLVRRLAGRTGALAAAAAAAAAPGLVVMSQVMRQYAFLLLFETAALLFLARHMDAGRRRDLAAYAAALLLAVASHYSMLLVLPALGAVWIHQAATHRWDRRRVLAVAAAHAPALLLAAALVVRHIFRTFIGQRYWDDLTSGYLQGYIAEVPSDFLTLPYGTGAYLFGGAAFLALGPWLLAGLWLMARRGRAVWLLFGGVILATAVTLSWARLYPLGCTRHAVYLLPLFLVPLGVSVQAAVDRGARAAAIAGLATAAAAVALAAAGPAVTLPHTAKNWRKERTVPRSVYFALQPALEAALDRPGVLLMDLETFYALAPVIGADRPGERFVGPSRIYAFRWRERRVFITGTWRWERLSSRRSVPRALASFIQDIRRNASGEAPAIDREVAVVRFGPPESLLPPLRRRAASLGHDNLLTVLHETPDAQVFLLRTDRLLDSFRKASPPDRQPELSKADPLR
jgi:hypothetical protein